LVEVVVVAGCVLLSMLLAVLPLRLLPRKTGATPELLQRLADAKSSERLELALGHDDGETWLHELAAALGDARDDRQRVAAANELLASAEHVLAATERWPPTAAWLCVATTGMGAIAAARAGGMKLLLPVLLLGLLGTAVCLWAQRARRRSVERQRELLDGVVQAMVGPLYDVELVLPVRRSKRRRKSRR